MRQKTCPLSESILLYLLAHFMAKQYSQQKLMFISHGCFLDLGLEYSWIHVSITTSHQNVLRLFCINITHNRRIDETEKSQEIMQ